MNKVICDVCGTDYPETSSQCPICGCARGEEGQTSAGNSSQEETRSYTYVKGGRFSKSNVRKRLKAQARQAAEREEEARRKIVREDPRDLDRTDDIDDEDDEDLDDDDEDETDVDDNFAELMAGLSSIAQSIFGDNVSVHIVVE